MLTTRSSSKQYHVFAEGVTVVVTVSIEELALINLIKHREYTPATFLIHNPSSLAAFQKKNKKPVFFPAAGRADNWKYIRVQRVDCAAANVM